MMPGRKRFKTRYKAKKGRGEEVQGSVYTSRPSRGKSDDVRMRHLLDNDYSRNGAPKPDPMSTPLPGMARRTERVVR